MLLIMLVKSVVSQHGYAAQLQGENAVLAIRKGFIDFNDPGFRDLDASSTMVFWAKYHEVEANTKRFLFSWTNKVCLSINTSPFSCLRSTIIPHKHITPRS